MTRLTPPIPRSTKARRRETIDAAVSDEDDDRRRGERIPINDEFGRLAETTYISDLSEYGVYVKTTQPPALGSMVALRFTVLLDDPVLIEAQGRVVRHADDQSGMGIEFTDLSPEAILKINDVMARQRPRESGPPMGQVPGQREELTVRRPGLKPDDVDERDTARYRALGVVGKRGAREVLGTGEFEVVEEDDA